MCTDQIMICTAGVGCILLISLVMVIAALWMVVRYIKRHEG